MLSYHSVFPSTQTRSHTHTHIAHCLETGKLCGTFSPLRCATDVIFSYTIKWWISPATGWARVSFVVFLCFWCQNISPPKHIRMFGLYAYALPMVRGCMLSDFGIIFIYICVSHATLLNLLHFSRIHYLYLSFSLASSLEFPVAWYTHLQIVCVQNSMLWWKTSRMVQRKKFSSLTVTLNRIGSFVSNGISLLHYLSSRVVFNQISNCFISIQ